MNVVAICLQKKDVNMQYVKRYMMVALVAITTAAQAQSIPPSGKHYLDLGVLGGYNLDNKGSVYGGGVNYEYRPFKNWGFTAGLNYEFTKSDYGFDYWTGQATEKLGDQQQHLYSASAGARYYLGRFFVGAAFGLGYERSMVTLDDLKGTTSERYGLYQHYYMGYQIPLSNNHRIEIVGGAFGSGSLKVGGGLRYKFGF